MANPRLEFTEGLALFCKFEADGVLSEFFSEAYELAFDRWERVPWWRPLRKRERHAQMSLVLALMQYSIQLGSVRTGAGRAMNAVDRIWQAV